MPKLILQKSHVKAHTRRSPSGKVVHVVDHTRQTKTTDEITNDIFGRNAPKHISDPKEWQRQYVKHEGDFHKVRVPLMAIDHGLPPSDPDHVQRLAKQDGKYDPVVIGTNPGYGRVYYDVSGKGGGAASETFMLDGKHRVAAARLRGDRYIDAWVHENLLPYFEKQNAQYKEAYEKVRGDIKEFLRCRRDGEGAYFPLSALKRAVENGLLTEHQLGRIREEGEWLNKRGELLSLEVVDKNKNPIGKAMGNDLQKSHYYVLSDDAKKQAASGKSIHFSSATTKHPIAKDEGGGFNYKSVPAGGMIWITVNKPDSPLYGRHIPLMSRGGGRFTGVSLNPHSKAQQSIVGREFDFSQRKEPTPEEKERTAEKEKRRAERDAQEKELREGRKEAVRQKKAAIEETMGVSLEPDDKAKKNVAERAKQAAESVGAEKEDVEKFVQKKTREYERAHEQWVKMQVAKVESHLKKQISAARTGEQIPEFEGLDRRPTIRINAGEIGVVPVEEAQDIQNAMPKNVAEAVEQIGATANDFISDRLNPDVVDAATEQAQAKVDVEADAMAKAPWEAISGAIQILQDAENERGLSDEQQAALMHLEAAAESYADYKDTDFSPFATMAIQSIHDAIYGADDDGVPHETVRIAEKAHTKFQYDYAVEKAENENNEATLADPHTEGAELEKTMKMAALFAEMNEYIKKFAKGMHKKESGEGELGRASLVELLREAASAEIVPDPDVDSKLKSNDMYLTSDGVEGVALQAAFHGMTAEFDRSLEEYGIGDRDLMRATVQGAAEAFVGIATIVFDSPSFDRRLVEGLGIEGASAIMAAEIAHRMFGDKKTDDSRRVGIERAEKVLEALKSLKVGADNVMMGDAVDEVTRLRKLNAMYEEQSKEPIKDKDGNVMPGMTLLTDATARKLKSQNLAEMKKTLGYAWGTINSQATLVHQLESMIALEKSGKGVGKVDYKAKRFQVAYGFDREEVVDRLKKMGVPIGNGVNLEKTEGGAYQVSANLKALQKIRAKITSDSGVVGRARQVAEYMASPIGDEDLKPFWMSEGNQLHDTQVKASRKNLAQGNLINAEQVGGGKTLVGWNTMMTLMHEKTLGSKPIKGKVNILVVPDGIPDQWKSEINKFSKPEYAAQLEHQEGAGTLKTEGEISARAKQMLDAAKSGKVIMLTHSQYGRDAAALAHINQYYQHALGKGGPIGAVVIDEAHDLISKGSGTGVRRAIRASKAQHRIAMTGTPSKKELRELFDMASWVTHSDGLRGKARLLDSPSKLDYLFRGLGEFSGPHMKAVSEELIARMAPFMTNSATPRTWEMKYDTKGANGEIKLTDSQKTRIGEIDQEFSAKIREARIKAKEAAGRGEPYRGSSISQIEKTRDTAMRRVIQSSKDWRDNAKAVEFEKHLRALLAKDPNHRMIVFSEFPEERKMLADVVAHVMGTPKSGDNAGHVDLMANSDDVNKMRDLKNRPRVAIAGLKNQTGLNAQHLDEVVHFSLPETASDDEQREGRVDRPGHEDYSDVSHHTYFVQSDHHIDQQRNTQLERQKRQVQISTARIPKSKLDGLDHYLKRAYDDKGVAD